MVVLRTPKLAADVRSEGGLASLLPLNSRGDSHSWPQHLDATAEGSHSKLSIPTLDTGFVAKKECNECLDLMLCSSV